MNGSAWPGWIFCSWPALPGGSMPRKNWAGAVLVFAAGFLLPFFFSVVPAGTPSTIYANAMADTPLALLFGGTLCLYAAAGGRKHM